MNHSNKIFIALFIILYIIKMTTAAIIPNKLSSITKTIRRPEMLHQLPIKVIKREIKEPKLIDDDMDLETAAGTNLLRPLFVYRRSHQHQQQRQFAKAYQQRTRIR